jgi:hypothetical protein
VQFAKAFGESAATRDCGAIAQRNAPQSLGTLESTLNPLDFSWVCDEFS